MKLLLLALISVVSASTYVKRRSNLSPSNLNDIMHTRLNGNRGWSQFNYSLYLDKWLAYGGKRFDIGEMSAHNVVSTDSYVLIGVIKLIFIQYLNMTKVPADRQGFARSVQKQSGKMEYSRLSGSARNKMIGRGKVTKLHQKVVKYMKDMSHKHETCRALTAKTRYMYVLLNVDISIRATMMELLLVYLNNLHI